MTDIWALVLAAVVLCSVPGGVFLQHNEGLQCEFQDDGDYDCRGKSFSSVPENIPGSVTVLYLDRNNLTVLGNDELLNKGGANIEILTLRWNAIAELGDEAFNGLTNLSAVSLLGNNITVFNKDIISGNLNMKDITLSENPIKLPESETEPIINSASLEYLELVSCNLPRISEGLFSGVPNLRELKLALNRLTTVNWLSINHLNKLTHIDFTRNDISHVPCQAERLLPLNELNELPLETVPLRASNSTDIFSLLGNPLVCDCCVSLMSYALGIDSWVVWQSCQTLEDAGGDIGAPEVLNQCYIKFMEDYNRTVSDLH